MKEIRAENLRAVGAMKMSEMTFSSAFNLHYLQYPPIPLSAVLNNAEASHVR
jgi:hypothetical protein